MSNWPSTIALLLVVVLGTTGAGVVPTAGEQTATDANRIDSCTTITEPGYYVLTQDVADATGICIRIEASDVVLDGNGHTIDGVQNESTLDTYVNASYGVVPEAENRTNATVENLSAVPSTPQFANVGVAANTTDELSNVTVTGLTVQQFFFGIYYDNVSDSAVSNVTVTGNGDGVEVYNATTVTVSESALTENAWGLYTWNVTDSTLGSLTADDNRETGLYLTASTNVTISNSSANGNDASGVILDYTNESSVVDTEANRNRYGGVPVILSANNTLRNVTTAGNGHDGISLFENSTDNYVVDSTVANTTGEDDFTAATGFSAGLAILDNSTDNLVENVTASNNTDWAFYSRNNTTSNVVRNFTIADENVTTSFTGADFALDAADERPTPPSDYEAIGTYLNATNTSPDSYLFLNVSYAQDDLGAVEESTLRLWEYEDGNWSEVDGVTGVNAEANYVYGNVTDFSVFAPLGQPTANESDGMAVNESDAANESTAAGENESDAPERNETP